ncbi:MAG: carboxypeptidase-like regulatory domain-containing protein [Terracidiphilus sp.]
MRIFRFQTAILAVTLLVVGSLAFVNVPVAMAQVTAASIHGTVTDPSGAVVPDAKVTVLNNATGISTDTTSNKTGYFTITNLQAGGPYTVTVSAGGFESFVATGLTLNANDNREVQATMKVAGTGATTVQVTATGMQVETANTQLEQTVQDVQIENLPMLGGDAASLEKLVPGVMESSDRFGAFSVNGAQTTDDSYLVDGIDNNDGPLQDEGLTINPDALAEENIITSTLNPEFSRNGGSVVNQVLKSGTNQLHGSGFDYYRDTFMNNGNYFSQLRPPFHQNIYGGTLGGPIIKNRLFLFVAYQGFRNRTGSTTQTAVFQSGILPTGSNPGGNFSNEQNVATGDTNINAGLTDNDIPFDITTGPGAKYPGAMCGPGTPYPAWSDCFPAGTAVNIAPSSFNSVALGLAKQYVPAGNAGTALAPLYNFNTADTGAGDQGVLRADYHLGSKDSFYGTGVFQSSPTTDSLSFGGSDLPGFGQINAEHFKLFSGTETHTFNANNLNELRAGYFRFNYAAVYPAKVASPSSVGFDIYPNNKLSGVPYMSLTGLFSLGFSREGPQPRKDTNLTFGDNYTSVFHNHTLKFGASVEQFRVNNPYSADNAGSFGFQGAGAYSSGDPGIDFLLGIPDTYQQTSDGFTDTLAYEEYAFAQDSWKASSDLTVNYGIAWDVETPNKNEQFKGEGITCFTVGGPASKVFPGGFAGLTFPGDPGCNTAGGATTKYNHFGPRLGFAWSPSSGPEGLIGESGAHKFSIRAGFGMYFNRDAEEGQLQNLGDTPNFLNSLGAADFGGSPGFINPFADVAGNGSEPSPFPYTPPAPGVPLDWNQYVYQDTSSIAKNYTSPYSYNFNLNIQRQLTSAMILQIGYVGSVGHKLAVAYEADPVTPAGHAACLANPSCVANIQLIDLYFPQYSAEPVIFNGSPAYLSMGQLGTEGSSNYNSLQVSVNNNLWHGLFFTFAYTYSHALDDASGLESSGFNGPGTNYFPGYHHLSYGSSDFDARQRVVVSYDYGIPLLASMNHQAIVKEALGSWHFAGFTVLQSGFPVDITDYGSYWSGYCGAYSYYACPDVPNTSSFHIAKENIRTTAQSNDGIGTYFNSSTFSQEAIGTFGNVGRGLIHGPGFNYSDLSLYKYFPLGGDGTRAIQIMMQAANAFNHANFDNPDGNYTDGPYFGTVTAVRASADYNGDPKGGRTVQLVARIRF